MILGDTRLRLAAVRGRIVEGSRGVYVFRMSKAVISLPELAFAGVLHPNSEEIRRQLAAILASPAFHGSKRCQKFLEHVCDKTLAGEEGTLKERTVAIEVFGRAPESDLGEDTIVRVGAREVRKRLAQFYVSPGEGAPSQGEDRSSSRHVCAGVPVRGGSQRAGDGAGASLLPPVEVLVRAHFLVAAAWRPGGRCDGAGDRGAGRLFEIDGGEPPNVAAFREFWQPVLKSAEPLTAAVA